MSKEVISLPSTSMTEEEKSALQKEVKIDATSLPSLSPKEEKREVEKKEGDMSLSILAKRKRSDQEASGSKEKFYVTEEDSRLLSLYGFSIKSTVADGPPHPVSSNLGYGKNQSGCPVVAKIGASIMEYKILSYLEIMYLQGKSPKVAPLVYNMLTSVSYPGVHILIMEQLQQVVFMGMLENGQNRLTQLVSQLHKLGIVHGDIHSYNICVDKEKRLLLVDFETASWIKNQQRIEADWEQVEELRKCSLWRSITSQKE